MITTIRMSAPTQSKSMPWPTPQRPAQAAPVRRECIGRGNPGERENGGLGITPCFVDPKLMPDWNKIWPGSIHPFAGEDQD